jgi:hypothetical protein
MANLDGSRSHGGKRDVPGRLPDFLGLEYGGLLTVGPALRIHVSEAVRALPPLVRQLSM